MNKKERNMEAFHGFVIGVIFTSIIYGYLVA